MIRFAMCIVLALGACALRADEFIVANEALFHQLVPKGAKLEELGCGFGSTEGPVWVGGDDGFLVFSKMSKGAELKKWSTEKGFETYRKPSFGTNGNALDPDGNIVSCEQARRRIARVGPDGESIPLSDSYNGKKLNCPNDLTIRSDGMIWFTDPFYGPWFGPMEQEGKFVYRYDPKTGKTTRAVEDVPIPNGICLSPDEKILYVGQAGRGRYIKAFDVAADGSLSNGRIALKIMDGICDGFKCDRDGNIFAATQTGVQIFTPEGKHVGTIPMEPHPSNVCFGGKDRKTLFITAHDCVFKIDLNAAGPRRY